MNLDPIKALSGRWREEADRYARDGALASADALLRRVADELETLLGEWWTEPLDLQAAAEEMSLTYRALQKRVERGQVQNAGKPGAPRVRRCDLFGGDGPKLATGEPDLAEEVLVSRLTGP